MATTAVSVALDWTPNTNHVGFYIAQARGIYAQHGLSVSIISPHSDNYSQTPASKVASKTATFGLGPSETIFSYHLPPQRPKLVAVATVLQEDLSSIVTLRESGIDQPQKLDGKKYASYGARFEGRIVQQMIQQDGGKGDFEEIVPEKLGIWNTLLEKVADATWIFSGWEGCSASIAGIQLNEFRLSSYGIPYGYSPVVFSHPSTLQEFPDVVRRFLRATSLGFIWATMEATISEAANLFLEQVCKEHPDLPKGTVPSELVHRSLEFLKDHFLDSKSTWGVMEDQKWEDYLTWLNKEQLLTSYIQSRNPVSGVSVTLDDLRSGNTGSPLPSDHITSHALYTNKFLT
jgi:ABC-type nitrate/sulfonate/bicarbonate transport system substrate-binding protein